MSQQRETDITISLCMIVKDEEDCIASCLDSVQGIVDEMIIVDTGSTDRTKEIVRRYTDKIYDFPWIDDFAAARNHAFSLATQEYILWLDADDIIKEEDRQKLIKLKKTLDPMMDAVNMHYQLAFDNHGNCTYSLRRNRLVKHSRAFQWIGAVHEFLGVSGHVLNSDICITHTGVRTDVGRNLRIYEKRLAQGENFSPRDLYYYANELRDNAILDKAIEYYQKFLATDQGWVEDNLATCGKLADIFFSRGDKENYLKYIYKTFEYDTPRAESCCRLGHYDMEAGKFKQAAFWYKLATQLEKPQDTWGPLIHACWTWLPHLQLCVCYDRLGQYELAYQHNERAAEFIPDDPKILYNRKYLGERLGIDIQTS